MFILIVKTLLSCLVLINPLILSGNKVFEELAGSSLSFNWGTSLLFINFLSIYSYSKKEIRLDISLKNRRQHFFIIIIFI